MQRNEMTAFLAISAAASAVGSAMGLACLQAVLGLSLSSPVSLLVWLGASLLGFAAGHWAVEKLALGSRVQQRT